MGKAGAEKMEALRAEQKRLLEELDHAKGADAEILMERLTAIGDDISRVLGLSDAEIAEAERQSTEEVVERTRREIGIGGQLFRQALLGDQAALETLHKGSPEFGVAIAEGAISADDLKTLPASVLSALEDAANKKKH
jgi:hypothetical protein